MDKANDNTNTNTKVKSLYQHILELPCELQEQIWYKRHKTAMRPIFTFITNIHEYRDIKTFAHLYLTETNAAKKYNTHNNILYNIGVIELSTYLCSIYYTSVDAHCDGILQHLTRTNQHAPIMYRLGEIMMNYIYSCNRPIGTLCCFVNLLTQYVSTRDGECYKLIYRELCRGILDNRNKYRDYMHDMPLFTNCTRDMLFKQIQNIYDGNVI